MCAPGRYFSRNVSMTCSSCCKSASMVTTQSARSLTPSKRRSSAFCVPTLRASFRPLTLSSRAWSPRQSPRSRRGSHRRRDRRNCPARFARASKSASNRETSSVCPKKLLVKTRDDDGEPGATRSPGAAHWLRASPRRRFWQWSRWCSKQLQGLPAVLATPLGCSESNARVTRYRLDDTEAE